MKFAKYLPVEGEIKQGDKFFQDGKLLIRGEGKQRITGSQSTPKLAKLFLCTIDMQMGDKVIVIDNPLGVRVGEHRLTKLFLKMADENPLLSQFIFKPIEEILTQGIEDEQQFTDQEAEYLTTKPLT